MYLKMDIPLLFDCTAMKMYNIDETVTALKN